MINEGNVLEDLRNKIGHDNISTVKRIYNKTKKENEAKGFTAELLGESNIMKMALAPLTTKYNEIDTDFIEATITKYTTDDEEDMTIEELEEICLSDETEATFDFEDDEDDDVIEEEIVESSWKDVFKSTPKPKKFTKDHGEFEDTPLLTIIDRVTYKIKLLDPKGEPRHVSGIGRYGDYDANIYDIKVLGVSDETIYEEIHESGKQKGEPLCVKGKTYGLWLDKPKVWEIFVAFWRDTLGLGLPDGRPFYLKRTKKRSKKGNKYNVWKFLEVK